MSNDYSATEQRERLEGLAKQLKEKGAERTIKDAFAPIPAARPADYERPSLSLIVKLASLVVHVDELLSPTGHDFDRAAIRTIINDPEVNELLKAMRADALLPVKR